jgi:hypothetical protein
MIKVEISSDAFADLDDGFWFYEVQEAGLGDYFSSCLRADIDRLKISGGTHRCVYRDYLRLLSNVFPYGVFYTFEADIATVWAVIDCRRDPDWIRSHLDK